MSGAVPRIAEVLLDGPGQNLLNPETMGEAVRRLREADADPEVSAIILSGAGAHFCTGLDVESIRAGGDPVAFAGALVELLKVFPLLTKPIAARVHSDALASGSALVAACDYAVTTPDVRIGTIEAGNGIWPMVAQVPLIRRLGARAAMENIGSGEPFTAERAREVGLVNEVVAPEDLDDAVRRWLTAAARGGAAAAAGRPILYRLAELPYDDALEAALGAFAGMFEED